MNVGGDKMIYSIARMQIIAIETEKISFILKIATPQYGNDKCSEPLLHFCDYLQRILRRKQIIIKPKILHVGRYLPLWIARDVSKKQWVKSIGMVIASKL